MIEAGIFDGDLVIVQPRTQAQIGEIVVALLNDEATVKFLGGERDRLLLVPANSDYQPIPAEFATIVGRVIGVIRQVRIRRKIRSF
jgi:repressor LexA